MAIRQEQLYRQDEDLSAIYMRSLLARGQADSIQTREDLRTCTACGVRALFCQDGRGGWSRCSECGALA